MDRATICTALGQSDAVSCTREPSAYLIGTGDDSGELVLVLVLAFGYCFHDRGVVGAQVHEDVGDAGLRRRSVTSRLQGGGLTDLPYRLEEGIGGGVVAMPAC